MFRRILTAAITLALAAFLLVIGWPQLFGLQRAPGVAHAVSFVNWPTLTSYFDWDEGVIEVLQPEMSESERQGLELGSTRLKETVAKYLRR